MALRKTTSSASTLDCLEHITALGDASASLGLIGTLVFGICISASLENGPGLQNNEMHILFQTLATAYSTYTTTYSLLEYYYAQLLRNLHKAPAKDISSESSAPSSDTDNASLIQDGQISTSEFTEEVVSAFGGLNSPRHWARNTMWLSVVCLLFSVISKINPMEAFEELEEQVQSADWMSSTEKSCAFFLLLVIINVTVWVGVGGFDFKVYSLVSITGFVLTLANLFLIQSTLRVARLVSCIFLLAAIISVPVSVLRFRRAFSHLTQFTSIH
mmetsp:Transcript_95789/g.205526  ORF Transcript_95789/g.205526 Transcript_95789/m.205526 type:complete len:273 (-) Transcript_95789:35-853(-)